MKKHSNNGPAARFALGLEYDGSHYHGWQRQPGLKTVQGDLEKALGKIANHSIRVKCAGRTDTGVHACNQIVHFDTTAERDEKAWIFGVNSHLNKTIAVKWAKKVDSEFHARHKAIARRYLYLIYNSPIRPALLNTSVTWHYRRLDAELMHSAAQVLCGSHDFTSFRAVQCQANTPVRQIHHVSVKRQQNIVAIDIKANAFLHHMVRNIAGVLMHVGSGRRPSEWVGEVLAARDRGRGAETAPPYGLYFLGADYESPYTFDDTMQLPILGLFCSEDTNELV